VAGVEWGGKRVSTPSPSAPLSIRYQRVGWNDAVDRGDKVTNKQG